MTDMAVGPTRALQLAAVSGDRAGMARVTYIKPCKKRKAKRFK